MTRSPSRVLGALALALVATATAGLAMTSASAGTAAPALSTARAQIVAVARGELANDARNKEVNGSGDEDCNFYTGAVRERLGSCPNEGWGDDEWCADFVKYVWKTAGSVRNWSQLTGKAHSIRQYGLNYHTWHEAESGHSPQPGDAFTEIDANDSGFADHTGIVVENLGDGRFRTIEGNVPDRIDSFVRSVHDSDVWGFAAPVLETPDDPPPATHHYATGSSGVRFDARFRSFFRRPDNEVVEHRYTSGGVGWTNHEIDGAVASPPQVIVHRNDMWVVARGTDDQLKYRIHQTGGAWGSWLSVPGGFSGTPALAVRDDRMHVFIRSGAQVMYRYHDAGGGWNTEGGWLSLKAPAGVTPVSDPATGYLDDRMFVAVRGSDGNVWVRSYRYEPDPEWSDWTKLTGQFTGALSLTTHNGLVLFVFGRGSDGQVRYHSLTKGATGWAQNRTLAGNIGGSPAAISFDRRLTVYARTGAGEIIYRTQTDAGWSGWLELGKPGTSLPVDSSPMAMRYGATRIMAARGTNAQLYIRSYSDANSWSNWTLLSGTHAPLP
jgi:hypothetical protein